MEEAADLKKLLSDMESLRDTLHKVHTTLLAEMEGDTDHFVASSELDACGSVCLRTSRHAVETMQLILRECACRLNTFPSIVFVVV